MGAWQLELAANMCVREMYEMTLIPVKPPLYREYFPEPSDLPRFHTVSKIEDMLKVRVVRSWRASSIGRPLKSLNLAKEVWRGTFRH